MTDLLEVAERMSGPIRCICGFEAPLEGWDERAVKVDVGATETFHLCPNCGKEMSQAVHEVAFDRAGGVSGIARECVRLGTLLRDECCVDPSGSECVDMLDAARYLLGAVCWSTWYEGASPENRDALCEASRELTRIADAWYEEIFGNDKSEQEE